MSDESSKRQIPIVRAVGITESERFLGDLAERTFLSMWSYPSVYRDQGTANGREGKEVADLLVVFNNHIIIFSDKDCVFPNTGNLDVDWSRWYQNAVFEAAKQLWGAKRWISDFPKTLYLDRTCTQPFPIKLPDPTRARFHLIVVAHASTERCKAHRGGRGSLKLDTHVIGKQHKVSSAEGGQPFVVGQVDSKKPFVHILDDTSLKLLLGTLDTITDFTDYLTTKERLIRHNIRIVANSEEDLLARYFRRLGKKGKHVFSINRQSQVLQVDNEWEKFTRSPQRVMQILANDVSYTWDRLIETFSRHILAGTSYYTTHYHPAEREKSIRFLAAESRTRRRLLADALIELIDSTPLQMKAARVIQPSNTGDPYYVFLLLPKLASISYEEYRDGRRIILTDYCTVIKYLFPDAKDIMGIATETGQSVSRSEDVLYFDARQWSKKDNAEARKLHKELGYLSNVTKVRSKVREFPKLPS